MANPFKTLGPGVLVTAAFIGPGTITTASIAGARFGFALLWALLFSILATMVLQEMAVRLGLVTRRGLAEALRGSFKGHWTGLVAAVLIVAAVGIGNAAYEAGNLIGAALGLEAIFGTPANLWSIAVAVSAAALLASGIYALIERLLIVLVLIMSAVFLITLFQVQPDLGEMLQGALVPSVPEGSLLTIIALIGTTVVPYNLFLHSNAVQEKWDADVPVDEALQQARWDTGLSIGLGGLITLAVMSTSAAAFFGGSETFSAVEMARQLEPLLGSQAKNVFAAGLLAAGLSSAVTAPLAASYAVCGVMDWPTDIRSTRFKAIWASVLLFGTVFAAIGSSPLAVIMMAQATNGFLLPVCAVFLVLALNRSELMGRHRNRWVSNVASVLVIAVALLLGGVKIASLF